MENKVAEIIKVLDKKSIFYISNPSDIFYLTSFSGTFAKLILTQKKNYFITDSRYEGEIKNLKISSNFEILITKKFKKDLSLLLKDKKKIYLSKNTSLADYLLFKNKKIVFNEKLNQLRMIKTEEEINKIRNAIKITEEGIQHIIKILKKGITEREIAIEFEYFIKKKGADGLAFEPIIAFNKNSAVPHHKTGNDFLKENSLVLIDVGVKFNGYCSDLTRIICFNIIESHLSKIKKYYDILKKTRDFCLNFIKNGVLCFKPDKKARDYLKKHKLDTIFLHSLGHGLGIDIHEPPFIRKDSKDNLKKGMIITCEPGIYFNDEFGLRLEDDYLITDDIPEKLTKIDENLIII